MLPRADIRGLSTVVFRRGGAPTPGVRTPRRPRHSQTRAFFLREFGYLADECNTLVCEAWAEAQVSMAAAAARQYPGEGLSTLDARIRVVHGVEVLADSSDGEDAMCARFNAWVREHYPEARP